MTKQCHTISIGLHQVYNVQIHAHSPDAAMETIESMIKRIGLQDALLTLNAIDCPICNEQDAFIQHEWSEA